jgi:hypothetical protein
MNPGRIACVLEHLQADEVPEILHAIALFERCGVFTASDLSAWREAVRVRLAETSSPQTEA